MNVDNEAASRDLRATIRGRSDADIIAIFRARGGIVPTLDESFAGMVRAFAPSRARGQSAIVQYDILTPEGVTSYQLAIGNGRCVARRGTDESARITLRISFCDFLRLICGSLTSTKAVVFGRLRISGDVLFGATMQRWFEEVS